MILWVTIYDRREEEKVRWMIMIWKIIIIFLNMEYWNKLRIIEEMNNYLIIKKKKNYYLCFKIWKKFEWAQSQFKINAVLLLLDNGLKE